jgi:myo-inositol-1(or 4)-monophosphatase
MCKRVGLAAGAGLPDVAHAAMLGSMPTRPLPPLPNDLPDLEVRAAVAARLKVALRAAEQASATLLRFAGRVAVVEKSAIDLVTEADRAAEEQILAELRACFGDDTVLAEERDGDDGCAALRGHVSQIPWCWAVDPLDGTTNYTHGQLNFAVSIGLLRHGQPVLGVVAAPARREVFVGGLGVRATCNGQPIHVSACRKIDRALLGTGFPYDRRERLDELFRPLRAALMRSHGVRRAGSAAIDLCELAAGRLDGFWERGLHPWDLAAGAAIIAAAGGKLSGYDGGAHDLFAGRTVASNGALHCAVLDLLA